MFKPQAECDCRNISFSDFFNAATTIITLLILLAAVGQFAVQNRPRVSLTDITKLNFYETKNISGSKLSFDFKIKNYGNLHAFYRVSFPSNTGFQCKQGEEGFIMPDQDISLECSRIIGEYDVGKGQMGPCDAYLSEKMLIEYGVNKSSPDKQTLLRVIPRQPVPGVVVPLDCNLTWTIEDAS